MQSRNIRIITLILLIILSICLSSISISANPGYVIITTDAIYDASYSKAAIDAFKAQKDSHGYTTYIITESVWGGATGDETADKIRTWLHDNYEPAEKNIKYALLIGNPHPVTGDVPMKITYPGGGDSTRDVPTDYYYNDLSGDWDLDNDDRYGEKIDDFGPGGIEPGYDIIVGRIPHYPSDTSTDLNDILTKIIDYNDDTYNGACSWRTSVLMPIDPLDPSGDSAYLMGEYIKDDILIPNNWTYHLAL